MSEQYTSTDLMTSTYRKQYLCASEKWKMEDSRVRIGTEEKRREGRERVKKELWGWVCDRESWKVLTENSSCSPSCGIRERQQSPTCDPEPPHVSTVHHCSTWWSSERGKGAGLKGWMAGEAMIGQVGEKRDVRRVCKWVQDDGVSDWLSELKFWSGRLEVELEELDIVG